MVSEHLASLITLPETPPRLSDAVVFCTRLARGHYENFTLVSWLVPKRMRVPLYTLYGFCRTVDDVGDEAPGNRRLLLERLESELEAVYAGTPRHPVFVALKRTVAAFGLPREPFLKLIEANRLDQQKHRYETFDELLGYCGCSANPVGRLFLMLFDYRDSELFTLSDATCTALQLTNFWQDVKRDYAMGRIYLPGEEMKGFGVKEEDLAKDKANDRVKRLLRFQVNRTRDYFEAGLPLLDRVHGHLKVDVALFSRGGLAILDKIEQRGYDTLCARPALSRLEKAGLFISTLLFGRGRRWRHN
jgi:squalene synthase HpnC